MRRRKPCSAHFLLATKQAREPARTGQSWRTARSGTGEALEPLSRSVDALHPFDNAEVAFCAQAECLKSPFVTLAFVGGQRSFVTVKFDKRPFLAASLIRAGTLYSTSSSKTVRQTAEVQASLIPRMPSAPIHPKSICMQLPNSPFSCRPFYSVFPKRDYRHSKRQPKTAWHIDFREV